ncbi:hypothetical protein BCA37_20230 [Mycobacterium sp. djl-10]|nr:hypothetical protein BCA37_20230 [Mycobacterium sp. djl-10]
MGASKNAATHIGRIGGLAVALGVGAAIAGGAGAAWADSTDSAPSQSQTSDSGSGSKASATTSSGSKYTDSKKESKQQAGGSKSGSTQRDSTSESAADKTDGGGDDTAESDDKSSAKSERSNKAEKKLSSSRYGRSNDIDAEPAAEVTADASEDADDVEESSAPAVVTTVAASTSPTATETEEAAEAPDEPASPPVTPALTSMLAWVRKETARHLTFTPSSAVSVHTAAAAAAVVDPLPSRLPSTPLGWVTGSGTRWLDGKPVNATQNTSAEFGIGSTDLGIMWDGGTINGERFVHVAFGDSFRGPRMTGEWLNNALLISYDRDLESGLELADTGRVLGQFIDRSRGQLGLFGSEVTVIPTAGIQIDGTQYVNYMSVRSWDTPGRWTTNYSAITQFYPGSDGGDWRIVPSTIRSAGWMRSSTPYRAGDQNFQQMAYVLQPEDHVAEGEPRYLYAFGTPSGRAGSAYLSRVAEGDVTDLSKYDYWDGNKWVRGNAAVAKPVIGSNRSSGLFGFVVDWANDPNVFGGYLGGLFGPKTGGNVSEMSVQYNEYLDKYVVLYGDGNNNIQMRVADTPEAAWSAPVQLASSADYPGLYAPMIHPWSGTGLLEDSSGDSDYNNLYWNMSIWGDYNVVLMQTDLSPLRPVEV